MVKEWAEQQLAKSRQELVELQPQHKELFWQYLVLLTLGLVLIIGGVVTDRWPVVMLGWGVHILSAFWYIRFSKVHSRIGAARMRMEVYDLGIQVGETMLKEYKADQELLAKEAK